MAQSIVLRIGDCKIVLEGLDDASIQAFIGDPPYDLTGDNKKGTKRKKKAAKKGFMGNAWDATGITFSQEFWKFLYRKGTPGCIVKFFGASRTYHKMCRAMERGGFVDVKFGKNWIYGSGFPKSTNVSKQIDRVLGKTRKVVGTKKGIGGENLNDIVRGSKHVRDTSRTGAKGIGAYGTGAKQVSVDVEITAPESEEAIKYDGVGTACKPAWEPIIQARKPMEDGSIPPSCDDDVESAKIVEQVDDKEVSAEELGYKIFRENFPPSLPTVDEDGEEVDDDEISLELAELLGVVDFEAVEPEDFDVEGTLQSLQESVEDVDEDELEMKLREYIKKLASEINLGEDQCSLTIVEQMLREIGEDSAAHKVHLHNRGDDSILGDDGELEVELEDAKSDVECQQQEYVAMEEKFEKAEEENNALKDEQEQWEKERSSLVGNVEDLEDEKEQWEKDRSTLMGNVEDLDEQVSGLEKKVQHLARTIRTEDASSHNS